MMQAGTSGGPWLDRAGNVVGLQSGVMSLEGKPIGIAFLVPACSHSRAVEDALRRRDTRRGVLGGPIMGAGR